MAEADLVSELKDCDGTDAACRGECGGIAEALNRDCFCVTVSRNALRRELGSGGPNADLHAGILASRAHLFSETAVFVSPEQVERMRAVIGAVEHVVASPAYRAQVLQWAPPIARHDPGPLGAFMGYDFHLGESAPRLIEINTNAGGALLNAALARAQQACCEAMKPMLAASAPLSSLEDVYFEMFLSEWRRQRGERPLAGVAIVDDGPAEQFLYPEFVLAERLFRGRGLNAVIADPSSLALRRGALWQGDVRIDLVYNRLTDFALEEARHAVLRAAYLEGSAVITPNPRAHALYADKRNLAVLTDEAQLNAWGIPAATMATLRSGIPPTVRLTESNAPELWRRRRELFFKPAAGYGAKAAYRGDKLTRRVWAEIIAGRYVAQGRIAPSERGMLLDGALSSLKLDLRAYVYDGSVQLLAARLYQGQTTNFRTPGGGFAPVFVSP